MDIAYKIEHIAYQMQHIEHISDEIRHVTCKTTHIVKGFGHDAWILECNMIEYRHIM